MNKSLLTVFLIITSYTFAEPLMYNYSYGIDESKKGYLNLFLQDETGEPVYLLDSGRFLNSRVYLKDGDKRFYLRERGEYVINTFDNHYQIKWRVDSLEVLEDYYLIKDGFRYVITIENRTDKVRNVGVYLMYDTVLGESSKNHFLIDDYKIIDRERVYHGTEIPLSIRSENERRQGIEFRFMDNDTTPDSVILGNWDRLAYSKRWPYTPNDGGLFSYGYYSINDSGIGVVYNGINLKPDEKLVYSYSLLPYLEREVEIVDQETSEVVEKKKWFFNKSDDEQEDNVDTSDLVDTTEPADNVDTTDPVDNVHTSDLVDTTEPADNVETTEPIDIVDTSEPLDNVDTSEPVDNTRTSDPVDEETEKTTVTDDKNSDTLEKDEIMEMLEYIQKKKRGEDVSGYDFTEEDILKRLNSNNE